MQIRKITKEDYPNGKKVIYEYTSDKYYDLRLTEHENGWGIDLSLQNFDTPFHKYLEGEIFEEYLENIECYIAQIDEKEVGIVSFNHERWNNVVRINDLHINPSEQHKGIGSQLMSFVKKRARQLNARAIVLETQTSNYQAIQFYQKHGFHLIGLDAISYSNHDIENKEVRIEMGLFIK